MEDNYKPFDLEKAKAGAKVMTRGGRIVEILKFDRKDDYYPIVALVTNSKGKEDILTYTECGCNCCVVKETIDDLVMCPEDNNSKMIVLTKEDATAISVAEGFIQGCTTFFMGERSKSLARLAASLSQIRKKYDNQFEEE